MVPSDSVAVLGVPSDSVAVFGVPSDSVAVFGGFLDLTRDSSSDISIIAWCWGLVLGSGVGVWCWGLVLESGVGVWCVAIASGSRTSFASTGSLPGRCRGSERPCSRASSWGSIVSKAKDLLMSCLIEVALATLSLHVMSHRSCRFMLCFSDIVASCHVSSKVPLHVML